MEAFAGRYRLIDLIGTGGMGSVWRAWDLRRSAYVAAKVLGQHDAGTLLRFVREQSVRIQHPHVVAPHGWAADDDKVVFAMDLVRGGSVATLLGDHGPLPPSYVAVLLDQLLHALSAVHAAGVVHRDLKPANLLLDATGTGLPHLRLSDFGVAGLIDEPRMTRNSTILGTPGYLAPEQLSGADPDPRQDLYAVGAVAHELLTGDRPTPTGSLPPADGPLAAFIHTCTATNPSDRPTTAQAAARLLSESGALPSPGSLPWINLPDAPEVFDQLPPLPPTWTPTGPTNPTAQPPGTPGSAHPTGPTSSAEPTGPTGPSGSAQAAGGVRPQRAQAFQPQVTRQLPAGDAPVPQVTGVGRAGDAPVPQVTGVGQAGDAPVPQMTGVGRAGSAPVPPAAEAGQVVEASGRRRGLVWLAVGSFVGAAGLIGSAVWILVR
ncbi:protein kinase [Kribbella sp. NBC_00482]|uniref:serine/threonine-protein kinase n=1 Tax=Kribbella sp. NBC_00482 TaxID=2975968 RepID=UPI002E19373B